MTAAAADSPDSAWGLFRSDLARSWALWLAQPMLPLLVILLEVALFAPSFARTSKGTNPALVAVLLPLELVLCGWLGAERVWYLRGFKGQTMSLRELPAILYGFVGRYAVLGIIVVVPIVPFAFAAAHAHHWRGLLVATVPLVVVDGALTFVPPALAFSTRRVSEAFGIGWSMLRESWPKCGWYVLAPPLAAQTILRVIPRSEVPRAASLSLALVVALPGLLFKGATAAFYLRRHPVGDSGAAFMRLSDS